MKPIIFNTDMEQAILEGRKTQTRRVIKPQPTIYDKTWSYKESRCKPINDLSLLVNSAPYKIGEILWVKESCCAMFDTITNQPAGYIYKSDGLDQKQIRWSSPRYMPRAAARIFLRVTDVRVERLQDISSEDAKAEGSYLNRCPCIPASKNKTPINSDKLFEQHWCYIHGNIFKKLWDSLNAKRGYGWDVNPWVWVYEFERVENE